MKKNKHVLALFFCLAVILLLIGGNGYGQPAPLPKIFKSVPSGYSSEKIEVKFKEGTVVDDPGVLLPLNLLDSVERISPLFTAPKERLKELRAQGEERSKKKLPDLTLWFMITLKEGVDPVKFMERLRGLNNVEVVEPAPLPAPPPATTPNFTGDQGYLDPATEGIDANYSWTVAGGNGTGVKIYDVEYSWNQNHEDLSKVHGISLLLNPGDSAIDPFNDNNHGTAVLGEMIADNNAIGVTGIAWGADIGLAPANTANLGYNPANAILLAVADGSPGDVILIEQQACVCNLTCVPATESGYGPLEWQSSVFHAIQTAVAHGIVVVEAAGNGVVNLDQAACGTYFDRNVQDSGAIIVGAGCSPHKHGGGFDRQREDYSTYGSRVDVQGWGDNVTTTGYDLTESKSGYDNPDDPTNPNYYYTYKFSGTSSASPMVAGAVADLEGVALSRFGAAATFDVRQLLVETGSPQLGNTAQHIGPRPNLKPAIQTMSPPLITSLSPTSGTVGTVVTITGKYFGPSQGSSVVSFNGVPVTAYTSWSDTAIKCTVPKGASTGPVVVTTTVGPSNEKTSTVKPPLISPLSPTSGTVGTAVTIKGKYFGSTQGSSTVSFNGTQVTTYTSWSDTTIKCTVPMGATTGPVVVTTTVGPSNEKTFTVKPPLISSLSPTSGTVGIAVTIKGKYFGPTQGSSTVSFNGTPVTTYTSWSDTTIKCTVPTGASTGPVVVSTAVGASNGKNFTVKP